MCCTMWQWIYPSESFHCQKQHGQPNKHHFKKVNDLEIHYFTCPTVNESSDYKFIKISNKVLTKKKLKSIIFMLQEK